MRKEILKYLILVALALGSAPAYSALWQWSRVASSNATADPSINWSEGQSPSSINDSARALMARVADYRDDISGSITTGGTSTAFTVTTNQVLNSVPVTGQLLAFTPHTTNGVNPTLRADGGTVYAIQQSPGVAVGAATLVEGTPYTMKFDGTAWVLRNFYGNPYAVPIGGLMAYTGATAPNSNFVLPAGQCISRTTYAAYFTQVSTTFGVCDGTTTFGVPDMRGRSVAGLDNLNGSPASRLTTTYFGTSPTVLGNVGGAQNVTISTAQIPAHSHGITDPGHTHTSDLLGAQGGGLVGGGSSVNAAVSPASQTLTTNVTNITINNTGGGSPVATIQPTMVLTYILRVI